MTSETSTYGSVYTHHEGSDHEGSDESPRAGVCRCENQLAHWDWAGKPHPNLPAWCQAAIQNELQAASSIAVDEGKLSVQVIKQDTHDDLCNRSRL